MRRESWRTFTGVTGHHEREMFTFRRRDTAACIRALRDNGASTFSELARTTGLSCHTVESIVFELVTHDLVTEDARPSGTAPKVARPTRRYRCNETAACMASVDLGLHRVTVLVSNLAGVIVAHLARELPDGIDGGSLAGLVSEVLAEALGARGLVTDSLAAVTVCVTGIVDDGGRLLQSNVLPEWNGVDLAARFGVGLSCAVIAEIGVNMAAVGEMHSGAAQNVDDVAFMIVGHRISAAIRLNVTLHRGRNFAAGEVGGSGAQGWGYQTCMKPAFRARSWAGLGKTCSLPRRPVTPQ